MIACCTSGERVVFPLDDVSRIRSGRIWATNCCVIEPIRHRI